MKICPTNMICFQETTFIIIVIVLIFLLIFTYQSYNMSQIKYLERQESVNQYNSNLPLFVSNLSNNTSCNDTLFDAYAGPFKNDHIKVRNSCNNNMMGYGVPINIKTQSIDSDFRQIGLLTSENVDSLILPLLGRPLITHRDTWQYYALSERNLKVPVISNNKNCTNRFGCNSLSDDDIVSVNGYGGNFKVSLYENDTLTYLPVV